jgi:hypothetical protein
MYTLLRSAKARDLLRQEGLPLGLSLLVAELFFKFHSFTLECVGFLAVWTALSAALAAVKSRLTGKQTA